MNYKVLLLSLLLFLKGQNMASAQNVDRLTARNVAESFFNKNVKKDRGNQSIHFEDVTAETDFQNFYIFNADSGFVIVASDERVVPILGYSKTSPFGTENLPDNLRLWLEGYDEQIQNVKEDAAPASFDTQSKWNALKAGEPISSRGSRGNVIDSLPTWDQYSRFDTSLVLYNNLCPTIEGKHCLTGCVATAMAQIFKYWNYPIHGTGYHEYFWRGQRIEADFGATNYDWAHMTLNYGPSSTEEEINAVATLMKHCGVSVEMKYGIKGSGTPPQTHPFTTYFDYSEAIRELSMLNYTTEEWVNLLKNEIDHQRPIEYSGYTPNEGHTFICYGYDDNDMFAFNWGWGGTHNDDYYAIGALEMDLNIINNAIINIMPNDRNMAIPTNIVVEPNNGALQLTWNASSGAVSYMVLRNGQYLAETDQTWYSDTEVYGGDYTYQVVAVGFNSRASLPSDAVTYSFPYETPSPVSLAVNVTGSSVMLAWDTPANPTIQLFHHKHPFEGSEIRYIGGEKHDTCSMYEVFRPSELCSYANRYLNRIDYWVGNDAVGKKHTLTIYKGVFPNGLNVYTYEFIPSSFGLKWHYLSTPIQISGNEDVVVEITVENTSKRDEVFPYLESYDNLFSSYFMSVKENNLRRLPSGQHYIIDIFAKWAEELTYNVYRSDGEQTICIANNLTETSFTDNSVPDGDYTYFVKTNYYGGESQPSNEQEVVVGDCVFTITATASPTIGGTVNGGGSFHTGDEVILTATPNEGYSFIHWTENGTHISSSATYTFTASRPRNLVAHFSTGDYPVEITASANPNYAGTVSGAGTYEFGQTVTLTAIPNANYTFLKWVENYQEVSTSSTYSFIAEEDRNLVALFSLGSHSINVNVSPSEGGTITGSGNYAHGETVILVAVPNMRYEFVDWKEDGVTVSTAPTFYFSATSDRNLTATFQSCDYDMSAVCSTGQRLYYNVIDAVNNKVELTHPSGYAQPTGNINFPSTVWHSNTAYTVASIAENAFWGCSGLTGDLIIPNSVTSIGFQAFYGCSGFTGNLTIGNSVTSIGDGAFENCSGFTGDLVIPNSVISIGVAAFENCSGFTGNLTIGDSVTSIENYAFQYCSGFTGNLTIGNSVTSIGFFAFYNCSGFTGDLVIPNSVTSIDSFAFSGCSSFTGDLIIPNSVTEIRSGAFYNCSGFTGNLTIGNSVTSIGPNAFYQCSGFTGNLVIPNSVVSIGTYAFCGCSGFTGSLVIPNSVTSIGDESFRGCHGFSGDLVLPNSVTSIGYATFYDCSGFTGDLIIPNSVSEIDSYAFYRCSGFTGNLVISESVYSIGQYAFSGCNGFTGSLVIPNSVGVINKGAFQNCSGFNGSLTIPNSVHLIMEYAFSGCSGFKGSLTLPNTLGIVRANSFEYCSGFDGLLTIPASVTLVEECAFNGCGRIASINFHSPNPPAFGPYPFDGIDMNIPVIVPCSSYFAYRTALGYFTNLRETYYNDFGVVSDDVHMGNAFIITYPLCEEPHPATIWAQPNPGYEFSYWSWNDSLISTEASWTFAVSENMTLIAHFIYPGIPSVPTVNTSPVTDISPYTAILHGNVTFDNGSFVEERGFCWSTTSNPTINDMSQAIGEGIGEFSAAISFEPNTTYFVRAFAINTLGVGYGEEVSFTTDESSSMPEGAINGLFSINGDGDQIYFSQGNLQYQAITDTWRFAEKQYDIVGNTNNQVSETYDGWIDLFYWGTSGYDHGAACYQPWSISKNASDYYAYGSPTDNLFDGDGKADWGYNAISNGGNEENIWRTMRYEELDYIINNRDTPSGIRYAMATVNGVAGCILFPDDWNNEFYHINNSNNGNAASSANTIDGITWSTILENHGCVFLPTTGIRIGTVIELPSSMVGSYFSSSVNAQGEIGAFAFIINNNSSMLTIGYGINYAASVRLVHDFTSSSFTFIGSPSDHQWTTPSNWEGELMPTATTDAVTINGICELDVNATLASLTINDGNSLTVMANKTLTSGEIYSDASSKLILENGAQLHNNTPGVFASMKKTVEGYGNGIKWHLIATPMLSTPIEVATTIIPYDLFRYDEPQTYWMQQQDRMRGFNEFTNTIGYLYATQNDTNLCFTGELKPSGATVIVELSNTSEILPGFNLVGNPFPCNATIDRPYWVLGDNHKTLVEGSGPIKPCEAVFVKADGPNETVTFTRAEQ